MRHPAVLLVVSGLAAPLLHAQPLSPAGAITERTIPLAERAAHAAAPRQYGPPAGSIISMRDELENFPTGVSLAFPGLDAAPTSFTGPDGFEWGLNNLRGQLAPGFVQVVDLADSPFGGNSTQALRVRTAKARDPGQFFFGGDLRWNFPLTPIPGINTRASAELYISTIDERYSFETAATFLGFITSRALWGGTCVEDQPGECTDIGLPVGAILQLMILSPDPASGAIFLAAHYCRTAWGTTIPGCTPPSGFAIGDPVTPPIGAWSRWIVETTPDARIDYLIDHLDGNGETFIHRGSILVSSFIDRVGVNTSFQSQDAFLLMDNIEISGPAHYIPKPPRLECPYHDDLEWHPGGALLGQSARWFAALSSAASVIFDGARGKVLSQVNDVYVSNHHRREFATELPPEHASLNNDLVVSLDARFTGNTVRAFALFDGTDLVARIFRGHEDRTDPQNPVFIDSLFVQIDGAFTPLDDPFGNPDDVQPVIGQHIEDTGFVVPSDGEYRTITMRISANGALRVYVNDTLAYAGAAAFGPSIDALDFESENNTAGSGATLRIDDVRMACDAPSCATDFDFDGVTGFSDLNATLANFGASGLTGFTPGDANADGAVDFEDLNAVLAAFGASCK